MVHFIGMGSCAAVAMLLFACKGPGDTPPPVAAPSATPQPTDEHPPQEERARAASCGTVLPERRPAELAVRLTYHDRDRPEAMARWDIAADPRHCLEDELPAHLGYARPLCTPVTVVELETLYRALQQHRFDRLQMRRADELGPHSGGYVVRVHWGGGECTVADVTQDRELVSSDREDFRAIIDAVVSAARATRNAETEGGVDDAH